MPRLMQMTGPVIDLVYRVRAVPASGEEAVVTSFEMTVGGGFNALAAARAAGIEATMGGTLGTGPFGYTAAAALGDRDIACARPPIPDHDQGCCTVMLEPDGERSFIAWPGAEGRITAEALATIDLAHVDWVMVSGYTLHYPDARDALASWIEELPRDRRFLFDPSPMIAELPAALVDTMRNRADWISANAVEAGVMTGHTDAEVAARALAWGRQGALVRLGADGCLLATKGTLHRLPAHEVTPVDTNGAGDCHIGSFVAELSLSGDPLRAARYANIAAALSVTREGPATPPDRDEVLALL